MGELTQAISKLRMHFSTSMSRLQETTKPGSLRLSILPYRISSASENMAIDRGMLDLVRQSGGCLRFYGWNEDAITFGYAQKIEEVRHWIEQNRRTGNPRLVRRETGGGIVDHRNDLTYALAVTSQTSFHRTLASEAYRIVHKSLANALNALGVDSTFAQCPGRNCEKKPSPSADACFQKPVRHDLLANMNEEKIAGAAMRRTRNGILIQGSIQMTKYPPTDGLVQFFARELATAIQFESIPQPIEWPDVIPFPADISQFSGDAWNLKR